jgi:hypothetical protein
MITGKLKRTLKEKCPECGSILQFRTIDVKTMDKGEEITRPVEFIVCTSDMCDYERDVEQKRRRRQIDAVVL